MRNVIITHKYSIYHLLATLPLSYMKFAKFQIKRTKRKVNAFLCHPTHLNHLRRSYIVTLY